MHRVGVDARRADRVGACAFLRCIAANSDVLSRRSSATSLSRLRISACEVRSRDAEVRECEHARHKARPD